MPSLRCIIHAILYGPLLASNIYWKYFSKILKKSTSLIKFPTHHKHLQDNVTGNSQNLIDASNLDIESVVLQAYQSALHLTESLNILFVSYLSTTTQSFDMLRSFVLIFARTEWKKRDSKKGSEKL
jgi:hypothetical protein